MTNIQYDLNNEPHYFDDAPVVPLIDKSLTGVYYILNMVNGKVYVGSSSTSLSERWASHIVSLRGKYHDNKYLERVWHKYGEGAFRFKVLEVCPSEECVAKEQQWMDLYICYDRDLGYNLSPTAGSTFGLKFSDESRAKLSAVAKARPLMSEETRAKLSAAGMGRVPTEETRAKLSAAKKGKKEREEVTAAKRGRKRSEESRARMSAAQLARGIVHSEETKAKMSAALKGRDLVPAEQRARGEKIWLSVLTEDQVKTIRRTHIPGDREFGVCGLARVFGVTPRTISLIVRRITWGHVV